ncbi:response regulator [bacterium]|nr:response regulator [bacterium]
MHNETSMNLRFTKGHENSQRGFSGEISMNLRVSKENEDTRLRFSDERKWKIMLIDDDPLVLNSFLSLLNRDGYQTVGVPNALMALNLLEKDTFDIVLTELVMEEMRGDELLSAIFQKSPDIKVMVITGYGTLKMAIKAMQNGAYDYILKPCEYQDLKIRINRAISSIRAIESKKKAEKDLKDSEERHRILLENIHDLILLCEKDGNCIYASPSWKTQFGLSLSSLTGKGWLDLLSQEDKNKIAQALHSIEKQKGLNHELEIVLNGNSGVKRVFSGYMLLTKNPDDQKTLVFFFLHEITEYLKNKAQEREIERLNAAKDLAIATAHNINQPMTCIRGLTELMALKIENEGEDSLHLREIISQCDRVQKIIEKLLHINKYETIPYVDEDMLRLSEPEHEHASSKRQ